MLYYTKTNTFKNWINSNTRKVAQPNINSQEYQNALLPLPPLSKQKKSSVL